MNSYKTFIKHAAVVTRNAPTERGALKGVYHLENGGAMVTDTHRLYTAKDIHDFETDDLLTPNGKKMDEKYPDILKLLPTNEPVYEDIYKVDELITAIEVIEVTSKCSVSKKDPLKMFQFSDGRFSIELEQTTASYGFLNNRKYEDEIYSNYQYWKEALKMFRELKYEDLKLTIYGPLRPFTLTTLDERFTALLLPIRRY